MKKSKGHTVYKSNPKAFSKAQAIKRRWQKEGYTEATIEERSDRYIVITYRPAKSLSEAERVKQEGRY